MFLPWGFSTADTHQLSSSADMCNNSKHVEMAARGKRELSMSWTMVVTSCNSLSTSLSEVRNSEGETFKDFCPLEYTPPTQKGVQNINKEKNNMRVIFAIVCFCLREVKLKSEALRKNMTIWSGEDTLSKRKEEIHISWGIWVSAHCTSKKHTSK